MLVLIFFIVSIVFLNNILLSLFLRNQDHLHLNTDIILEFTVSKR